MGPINDSVKSFLSEANPFSLSTDRAEKAFQFYGITDSDTSSYRGVKDSFRRMKGKTKLSDKIAISGMLGLPMLGALAGGVYGFNQKREGSVSRFADIGFQAGGVAAAVATSYSPFMRRAVGRVKTAGIIGAATTTMATSLMMSEDSGALARAGVWAGATVAGALGGAGIAKFLSKSSSKSGKTINTNTVFSKPIAAIN